MTKPKAKPSSFADEVARTQNPAGSKCTVGLILRKLDPQLAADVEDAILNRPDLQGAAIARKLTAMGHRLGGDTVNRHRNRRCGCFRSDT